MFALQYLAILRLFGFLILDATALAAPSGTTGIHAIYTNGSTALASSTSSLGVGDYIASGLGLNHEGSNAGRMSTSPPGPTSAESSFQRNATFPVDQCWTKWSDYWKLISEAKTMYTTYTTERVFNSYTGWSIPARISTDQVVSTVVEGNGNFHTKTYVTTFVTSATIVQTFSTIEANTTETVTDRISTTITTPPCALPSYVRQCQESWIAWNSDGAVSYDQPACTQASISGSMCSSVLSQWLSYQRAEMGEISGKIGLQWLPDTNNGTTVWPSSTTNYYWPTSSAVAPGCTVGCQSCRVSGSRVKLLYWPPETKGSSNGTYIAATGSSQRVLTAVTDGTTLTSPTVYISFDKLHASNSCSVIGKTLSNIIVAVTNSATLSSLYGWDRYWGLQQTASFNFTDLYSTPVPHSIYMSQPRCASSSVSLVYSCLKYGSSAPAACSTGNTPLLCATTLPYEPVIAIPQEVQQLQSDWQTCIGGIIGVYDPPQALHEAVSAAGATLPGAVKTTQQVESSSDASTPATPSPTAAQVPSPTKAVITSETSQTKAIGSTASDTSDRSQVTEGAQSQADPGNAPTSDPKPAADPSSTNALDVLTAAETDAAQQSSTLRSGDPAQSGNNDSPVFTFDFSTSDNQNIGGSESTAAHPHNTAINPTSNNNPSDTASNQPLYTFDPPASVEQTDNPTQNQPTATITRSDGAATAFQSGSNIIIVDASSTQVLKPGQDTIIDNSQTVKFQNSQNLIVGDSTIPLHDAPSTPTASAAVWTASNGHTFSAIAQGSNLVIAGPDTTATLPNNENSATIVASQTISADTSNTNAGIIVDGSSLPLQPQPAAPTPAAAIWTAGNGDIFSAIPTTDSGIILLGKSSTITLSRGSAATFQGQTFSAARGGGGEVVVNGSKTMTVNTSGEATSLPVLATSRAGTSTSGEKSSTIASARASTSEVDGTTGSTTTTTGDSATSTSESSCIRRSPARIFWLSVLLLFMIMI